MPPTGLALQLDTTARELRRLNQLIGSQSIYEGQILKMPRMRKQFTAEQQQGKPEVMAAAGPQEGHLVQVIDKKGFAKQVWRKKEPESPRSIHAKHI